MKAGKAFSKKNMMNLFVKERELHFAGSLPPAQACRKKLIRQKSRQKYGCSTQEPAKPRIRKQQETHGWWREALPWIFGPQKAERKALAILGVLSSQ